MPQLKIGDKAPYFIGKNQEGKELNLNDLKGRNLILYFYPKDSTPGCTAEACDLRDNYNMWINRGYNILGVSPDDEKSHRKFIEKNSLPFDLMSDPDKVILKAYDAWGEKKLYGKVYEGVLRKTYVINSDGIIENIFEKVKTKDHTDQILNELKNNQ